MAIIDMVMPKMGESVQEGTVIGWKVQVGDKVEKDQILLDIATDKVDSEVPAPASGTLVEILTAPDETVEVGVPIARIDTEGGSPSPSKETPQSNPEPSEPVQEAPAEPVQQASNAVSGGGFFDMVMPKMGESVQEGTVISWKVQVGDKVEKDQILLDIATDKVDTEVPSPASGTLAEILAGPDETVEVGAVIARISQGNSVSAPSNATPPKAATASPAAVSPPSSQSGGTTPTAIPRRDNERFYSPLVRKLAAENGLSLEQVRNIPGSGKGNRVTKADILAYLESKPSQGSVSQAGIQTAQKSASSNQVSAPQKVSSFGEKKSLEELGLDPARVKVEKMGHMRKKIAQHMRASLDTSAHVYQVHEVDMTTVVELRNRVKDEFKQEYGFSLTYTSFIIWAACRALRQYPLVNARFNGDEILIPSYVNFGVAVSLPENGLVVPKIKEAENLTITGIQRKLNDLANRARASKLSPDELQGGTFTLTNMGGYGSIFGMPIISQPEVAILGCGAVQQRAVIKDGGIAARWMMYNALSFDHRLIDGALAANFLNAVSEALETLNPVQVGFDRRQS